MLVVLFILYDWFGCVVFFGIDVGCRYVFLY